MANEKIIIEKNLNQGTYDLVPYHPGLTTPQGARKNYNRVYSDHLPFVTSIAVGKKKKPVKFLSWNVLEFDGGNGFADKDDQGNLCINYGETKAQEAARHQRIAQAL
ncbi:MAG: hypothetical protein K2Q14_08400, partial [Gammaproteobacteria bacterium]|nr:hypothetical protein [Gammaproteobacteria bacterium]